MDEKRQAGAVVKVLFPLPLPKAYDYLAAEALTPGTFVEAPFGGRTALGVVWPGAPDAVDPGKLKPIAKKLPAEPLAASVIDFIDWVSAYTMFPPGAVLRLVMRSGDALYPPKGAPGFVATGKPPARMTPERRAVLDFLEARAAPASLAEITSAAGAGAGVVAGDRKSVV